MTCVSRLWRCGPTAFGVWQMASQVWERLAQQGVAVTERLVQEAGRQSGLMKIRAHLKEQFIQGPEGLRPRDGYLTEQLFKRVEQLQAQVQAGQAVRLSSRRSRSSRRDGRCSRLAPTRGCRRWVQRGT